MFSGGLLKFQIQILGAFVHDPRLLILPRPRAKKGVIRCRYPVVLPNQHFMSYVMFVVDTNRVRLERRKLVDRETMFSCCCVAIKNKYRNFCFSFRNCFQCFHWFDCSGFSYCFADAERSQQPMEPSNPSIGAVMRWLSGGVVSKLQCATTGSWEL